MGIGIPLSNMCLHLALHIEEVKILLVQLLGVSVVS